MEDLIRIEDDQEFEKEFQIQSTLENEGFYIGIIPNSILEKMENTILIGHVTNNGVLIPIYFLGLGEFKPT